MPLFPLLLIVVTTLVFGTAVRQLVLSRRGAVAAAPEERVVNLLRWSALLLGLLVAWMIGGTSDSLGRQLVIAPIGFGITLLAGSVLAELLVRPWFQPGPRQADLTPRSLRNHLPPRFTGLVACTALLGMVLLTWTTLTAQSDDMGRAGRSYAYSCDPTHSGARSPFPGSYYATPYLVGVAVALLLAVLAAVVITRRSLGGTPQQSRRHRDVGVGAAAAALGVTVSAPLVGLAFVTAITLLGVRCAPLLDRVIGGAAVGLGVLSLVTLAVSLGRLLVGGAAAAPAVVAHGEGGPRV